MLGKVSKVEELKKQHPELTIKTSPVTKGIQNQLEFLKNRLSIDQFSLEEEQKGLDAIVKERQA